MRKIANFLAFLLALSLAFSTFAGYSTVSANEVVTSKSQGFTPGDINSDGEINLNDVVSLAQSVADWKVEVITAALDPNGDLESNLDDVVLLAQYVADWQDAVLNNQIYNGKTYYNNTEELKVYNSAAPLTDQYRGVSSSVYHAYGHMLDDKTGRVYTDAQLTTELDRLQDAGIRYARTRFYSAWFWDNNGFNWNTKRANYFYNYCRNLDKRDISVMLQVGWHLGCFTHIENGSIDEVAYITKSESYPGDWYGETTGYDFSKCQNSEYQRMAKESLRFAHFYAETLRQTKARGINNISHLIYFTEPSYATSIVGKVTSKYHPSYNKEGGSADEYIFIVKTFQDKLKEEGVYDLVKHVGPNQGSIKHGDGLLRYMLERGYSDMFDVWTAHFYPESAVGSDHVYHNICDGVFRSYLAPLKEYNIYGKKEFWVDEFYARSKAEKLAVDSAWSGLKTVVGAISAQQLGINNISLWQIFDQLWTDQRNTGGEFVDGIHVCGSAPSLFTSDVPRRQYYFVSLFGKYNGYKNGEAYRTNNTEIKAKNSYIHIGATKTENGEWTITVINAGPTKYRVIIDFDKAINQTLYRHSVDTATITPNNTAKLAGADKTFSGVTTRFADVINAGSMAIYTGIKD